MFVTFPQFNNQLKPQLSAPPQWKLIFCQILVYGCNQQCRDSWTLIPHFSKRLFLAFLRNKYKYGEQDRNTNTGIRNSETPQMMCSLFWSGASTPTNTNIARNLASLSLSIIWFHLVIIICELQTLERGGDAIPPQGARDTFGWRKLSRLGGEGEWKPGTKRDVGQHGQMENYSQNRNAGKLFSKQFLSLLNSSQIETECQWLLRYFVGFQSERDFVAS